MKILGIETSCDETALSIVDCEGDLSNLKFTIIDSIINSQALLHASYGGVVPNLAKREHQRNLPILLEELMSKYDKKNIDTIAVTQGPGLEPALWVGINFAKDLGESWKIPVLPINHMEGHIASVLLQKESKENLEFPALALLISGGHTELVLAENWGKYKIVGQTRDDAVGEAFDKVARMLNLSYPGGPEISKLAEEHRIAFSTIPYILPRPMIKSDNLDFSFSGLKTSVLYMLQKIGLVTEDHKREIARDFEDSISEVLLSKTKKAIESYNVKTLIIGGGVIANKFLRQNFLNLKNHYIDLNILIPHQDLTTDNATMIAIAGYINHSLGKTESPAFKAEGNLKL